MAARLHNGPKSWASTLQKNVNSFLAQWNIDGTLIASLGAYAFGGFIAGFVLKKLGNLITLAVLVLLALMFCSSYFSIITINLAKIQTILGISLPHSIDAGIQQFTQWGRTHTLELIVTLIGAWFGYNIG